MTIAANRPLKGARPRAWGGRALGWWLTELRACRADLRRFIATRGRRSVTIEAGERYWLLRRGERPIGQVDAAAGEAAGLLRPDPHRRAAARAVIVEIPPERALAKTVVLPSGAGGQLDRVLGFEIARHFPFPAERVYFHHRIVGKDDGGAVTVEIVAVPRDIVDGICAALAEAGLRPAAIAVSAGPRSKPLFLPAAMLPAARARARHDALGIATVLAAIAALVSRPLAQDSALRSIDRELAALKPRAEAALGAGEAERHASERSAAILALRAARPPLVAALDALSRDLPNGSWLLSLSVAGREIVMDGLAPVGGDDRVGAGKEPRRHRHCVPLAAHPRRFRARAFPARRHAGRGEAMTVASRPAFGRIAALAILAALVALFCVGPLAVYGELIADNNDALAAKAALLRRYRALAATPTSRLAGGAGAALPGRAGIASVGLAAGNSQEQRRGGAGSSSGAAGAARRGAVRRDEDRGAGARQRRYGEPARPDLRDRDRAAGPLSRQSVDPIAMRASPARRRRARLPARHFRLQGGARS